MRGSVENRHLAEELPGPESIDRLSIAASGPSLDDEDQRLAGLSLAGEDFSGADSDVVEQGSESSEVAVTEIGEPGDGALACPSCGDWIAPRDIEAVVARGA